MNKNLIRKSIAILCATLMLLAALPVGALDSFETYSHSEADIAGVLAPSATEPTPETIEPAGASLPSRYTVTFRFDETENGSVEIVSGANQNYSTGEYTAPGGSTVTLAAVPDEGYRYKSGSIRVYYRESGNEIDVPVDEETLSFVVPDVRAYLLLYAEFEAFTPPPEPHSIGIYYQANEPTGDTVFVDRETAYAGETVTVTLNILPGTRSSNIFTSSRRTATAPKSNSFRRTRIPIPLSCPITT